MASMWDWMPGPSGMWDYLSQYPERYRDQIRQGLLEFSERGGSPMLSGGQLLSAINPLGPGIDDAILQAGSNVADVSNRIQRQGLATQEMLGQPTGEFQEMTAEEGALVPRLAMSLLGRRRPDVGKTGFFSPTSRALTKAQDKGTGQQFAKVVKKLKQEPSATGEATQGGLIELLEEAPGTMTKEQALSMWNPVELTETVRSGVEIEPDLEEVGSRRLENGDDEYDLRDRTTGEDFVLTVDHDAGNVYVQGYGGRFIDATEYGGSRINNQGFEDGIVAIEEWIKRRNSSGPPTQYGEDENLNLPGGTNAKEILVQLPDVNNEQRRAEIDAELQAIYSSPEWADYSSRRENRSLVGSSRVGEEARALKDERDRLQYGETYTGGHWDEPNVLAHIRTNERDVGGKKALHIEEIQSDWHQQGQKQGYGMGASSDDLEAAEQELRELAARYETKQAEIFAEIKNELAPFVPPTGALRIRAAEYPELKELDGQLATASRKAEDLRRARFEGVPDAPFKKNWHELAFKRALTEAVNDPTIERLTWTTGAVQADRYNLAKYIDSIEAQWSRQPTSFNDEVPYDLAIINKDGEPEFLRDIPRDELENYVGKEMAQKIIDDADGDVETYSGLDLEVGGEFHKNLYDKKITQFAKKFLKKYGVEPQQIPSGANYFDEVYGADGERYYIQPGGSRSGEFDIILGHGDWNEDHLWMRTFSNYEDAIEGLGRYGNPKDTPKDDLWSIDITPEMREEIMTQGVPLTQRRKPIGLMAGYA